MGLSEASGERRSTSEQGVVICLGIAAAVKDDVASQSSLGWFVSYVRG